MVQTDKQHIVVSTFLLYICIYTYTHYTYDDCYYSDDYYYYLCNVFTHVYTYTIYIYIYIHVGVCTYIYIYIYIYLHARDRHLGDRHGLSMASGGRFWTLCRGGCSGWGVQWMGVVLCNKLVYSVIYIYIERERERERERDVHTNNIYIYIYICIYMCSSLGGSSCGVSASPILLEYSYKTATKRHEKAQPRNPSQIRRQDINPSQARY